MFVRNRGSETPKAGRKVGYSVKHPYEEPLGKKPIEEFGLDINDWKRALNFPQQITRGISKFWSRGYKLQIKLQTSSFLESSHFSAEIPIFVLSPKPSC